jgi:hypothetical protein
VRQSEAEPRLLRVSSTGRNSARHAPLGNERVWPRRCDVGGVGRGRADRASAETRAARIEPEISAAVLNREPTILVSVSCFFRSAQPAAEAAVPADIFLEVG